MIAPEFGHWLAGFADGEGCFFIGKVPRNDHGFYCEFRIGLKRCDEPILRKIVERTGLGSISRIDNRWGGASAWSVRAKSDCRALVEIFDTYPLRAQKARDYAVWRRAVFAWLALPAGKWNRDYAEMRNLRAELSSMRTQMAKAS